MMNTQPEQHMTLKEFLELLNKESTKLACHDCLDSGELIICEKCKIARCDNHWKMELDYVLSLRPDQLVGRCDHKYGQLANRVCVCSVCQGLFVLDSPDEPEIPRREHKDCPILGDLEDNDVREEDNDHGEQEDNDGN